MTCWLTQQWLPMASPVTIVATPCVFDALHPRSKSSRTPSADSERMTLHHNGYANAHASAGVPSGGP
ncbi:MAG: hypothetical protein JWP83_1453 [Mycobacterium sp.]|jgi:hypothetical protein|nr:hypothetical protein [Mycobacterium sp.]